MTNPLSRVTPSSAVVTPAAREGIDAAIGNVMAHGTLSDYGPPIGQVKELEQIVGSRDGTHQRYVMTLRGFTARDGVFYPYEIGLMAQTWELRDDNRFHIDIWKHFMAMDGTRARSAHDSMVQERGGNVVGWGSSPTTPAEAEENLAANLPRWVTYTPPTSSPSALDDARRARAAIAPSVSAPLTLAPPAHGGALRR